MWLKAKFGWSERTAYNFISIAERFKVANKATLPIQPSAAYLLAALSVANEARKVVIEKAKGSEEITVSAAKEIVVQVKKKTKRRAKPILADKLSLRLMRMLERYR